MPAWNSVQINVKKLKASMSFSQKSQKDGYKILYDIATTKDFATLTEESWMEKKIQGACPLNNSDKRLYGCCCIATFKRFLMQE